MTRKPLAIPAHVSDDRAVRNAWMMALIGLAACGTSRVARLEPAHPSREPPPRADVVMAGVVDRRAATDTIGGGSESILGLAYDVETDRPLGPWLTTHVRTALRETALTRSADPVDTGARGGSPALQRRELAVAVVKFELTGKTWIKGTGVYDVALYEPERGLVAAKRIIVQTTDLATEDNDIAWSQRADRLARWSAIEIARWTSGQLP